MRGWKIHTFRDLPLPHQEEARKQLGAGGGVESGAQTTTPQATGCKRLRAQPDAVDARPARPSYSPRIVDAWLQECGLPCPLYELQFALPRKWRFDLAWPDHMVALEVQGGIFSQGRHNRGAALLKEWEKLNTAASLGWRVLFVQPQDLCTMETAELIRRALKL